MTRKTLQILRGFSLAMLALVTGAVGYFFFFRAAPDPGRQDPGTAPLRQDVRSTTREIEYVESRDGRPLFRVRARRNVATIEGLNELEQVQAVYYGRAGDREDEISADRCFYSVTENRVRFEGHVRLRTAQGYVLETSGLRYEKATESAAGDGEFRLSAPGLTGSGRGFRLDLRLRELAVPNPIHLRYAFDQARQVDPAARREGDVDLNAGRAWIGERDRRLRLEDGVVLRTTLSRLEGRSAELLLDEGNRVRSAVCREGARYLRSEKGSEIRLAGDAIHFLMRPGERTTLEEVRAERSARLETRDGTLSAGDIRIQAEPDGSIRQVLASGAARFQTPTDGRGIDGERLTLSFDPPMTLRRLDVDGRALMRQQGEKGRYELAAGTIRIEFRPGDPPSPDRLTAIGGAAFTFAGGDGTRMLCQSDELTARFDPAGRYPTRSDGQGHCTWNFIRPARQEQVDATGQRFGIEFFPQSADPSLFRLEGDVRARRTVGDRWSETSSDSLAGEFAPADHRRLAGLLQQGNVRFRDPLRQGQAREARLEGEVLRLIGKPAVESEGVITRAAEMTYDQRSGVLRGSGGVETVFTPGAAGGPQALPNLGTTDAAGPPKDKVYIHAPAVELAQGSRQVVFQGGCRMVQGRSVLTAARFVWDRQSGTFTAQDKVLLTAMVPDKSGPERRLEVRAGRMLYDPSRRKILFDQSVRTLSSDGDMTSAELWGTIEEGRGVTKLYARGGIRILQASREATGDRALIDLAGNRFVLQGAPARVVDRAAGQTTQGVQLTFFRGDDRIRVDSNAQMIDME